MQAIAHSGSNTRSQVVRVLAVTVPVIWIAVALLHPQELTAGSAGTWLTVHFAQLALAPLVGLAMWTLIGPLQGASASVARVALFLWIAWFSAFDAIAGIATGVLQNEGFGDVAKLLFQHQTVGGEFSLLGSVAHPMWIVVAVAAGLSLRRNGARPITWWAMFVSALFAAHAGPIAVVGLAGLSVAIWSPGSLAKAGENLRDRLPHSAEP